MATTEFLRHAVRSAAARSTLLPWKHLPKETANTALSLADFREQIPKALTHKKEFGFVGGSPQDPVLHLFQQLDTSSWQDWMMYAHSDPTLLYTRNLIDTDNETYSLLLLCWNPGKESPIHDHPSDGCWVKVMQGAIRESRYRQPVVGETKNSPLYCYQESTARTGEVTYIDDTQGFHKVGNPDSYISATLHLYSPPALQCKTWPTACEMPRDVRMKNYSEYGRKIL